MNPGQVTLLGSTICVMFTVHFAAQLISEHLFCWKKPKEQKAIIIITLMAPIYAIDSYVGLLDLQGTKAFFIYLNISISKNIVPDEIKGREIHHSFPMTLFSDPPANNARYKCRACMAESLVQSLWKRLGPTIKKWDPPKKSTLFPGGSHFFFKGARGLQTLDLHKLFSAIQMLNFFFQMADLSQFLCIKGIVFFCFWQGVVLDILVGLGIIRSHHVWLDVEHIEEALQNVLVCVEMVFFSAFQQYAYNFAPCRDDVASSTKLDKSKE
ncbi:hypothetical protein I3843_11G170600 [Carya illinoinensis]|nr:hypothetical protein I3843_11G170600 [Carya illinoinensis]